MALARRSRKGEVQVVDGSEIRQLVQNQEAFRRFVEVRFRQLDGDRDGRLSVTELQPAVADIGAAIGLPSRGSSAQADHIYSEVQNEFTRGKESVSKSEFQCVLSDILLGMAAGLKRDPIVILRINGEDLTEFVDSARYEPEAVAIFSQLESRSVSSRQCLTAALRQLTVDHGMPPACDSQVVENIIEPALQEMPMDHLDKPISQDAFLPEFKKFLGIIIQKLQRHPIIVAHTDNTFDGSGIRRLLSNKFEFGKLLDSVWRDIPKEHKEKTSKKYLRVALDRMADSVNLPPYGAVDQVDSVMNEAFKMANGDDGKAVDESEFKKLLTEILGAVMLQLDGNPISVSTNTVLHEIMSTSSTLLSPVVSSSSQ